MTRIIKGFSDFVNEGLNAPEPLTTLRDVLNPDNWPEGEGDERRALHVRAAIETSELFGFKLPDEVGELKALGLIDDDPSEILDLMRTAEHQLPLDSIVEVYNLLALTHRTKPEYLQFCKLFPGILTYDRELDEFRRPESSTVINEINLVSDDIGDEVRIVLFQDEAGTRAVEWEDQYNLSYFMLRSAVEARDEKGSRPDRSAIGVI